MGWVPPPVRRWPPNPYPIPDPPKTDPVLRWQVYVYGASAALGSASVLLWGWLT